MDIVSGYDVIAAMNKAYEGDKWYRNFTFSQETKFYNKEEKEEKIEIWHEAFSAPGKLTIKFKSKDSKNGVIFANNEIHIFKENETAVHKPFVHELLLTAFDVYFLKPAETSRVLDSLGFNLKKVREDVFEGRKVFVIGAEKGDDKSNQLWIDIERLYLHRMVYHKGNELRDVVLSEYEKMKKYWVARQVIFKQNGKLSMTEKYFDIKFPKEISKDVFDPDKFNGLKLE